MKKFVGIVALYLVLAGFVGLPLSEAATDSSEKNDMRERKSFHFIIRYHASVDASFLRRLIDEAEDCYRRIAQDFHFFREDPWVWDNRAVIYVYENRPAYLQATGMPEWSWAAAQPDKKQVHTFSGAWEGFRYALVHELTHLIFREYIGMSSVVPLCFDEGAAVYMERRNEREMVERKVKVLLNSSGYIPLAQLIKIRFHELSLVSNTGSGVSSNDRVRDFYVESFGLIHFLLKKYDRFKFSMFARKLRSGLSFEEAFFQSYRLLKTWDDVEREFKKFYG